MTQPDTTQQLHADFAFEALVDLAERIDIGPSKRGERRLIPITGGTFEGPMISGSVVPGGADWQLTRPDGVMEVDARYTIRAADGAHIHVRNRGIVVFPPLTEPFGQRPYVRTVAEFEAPLSSAHAWLNRSMFIGTLTLLGATRVRVRLYRVA